MITVVIPSALRGLTGGVEQVRVEDGRVRDLLATLERRFPGFSEALGAEFAVAVDGEILHDALLERVEPGSEVHFLPPIAGGGGR